MLRTALFLLLTLQLLPPPAAAQGGDLALILANSRYEGQRRANGAEAVLSVIPRLEAAGFETDLATDLTAPPMRSALQALDGRIGSERPERVIIVYAGHTVHSDQGTWLMGVDSGNPTVLSVDTTGLRLEALLAVAGRVQGGAIVAIGDLSYPSRPGPGLQPGLSGRTVVPQGVSLIHGAPDQIARVLDMLLVPGTNLRRAVEAVRGVRLEGFDPPWLTWLPEGHAPAENADRRAWAEALALDTVEGWQAYLASFPQGLFADQARAALAALENTPERIEENLGLTRDERRAVQRHLALLGFDPRGIDGIFGPGTRAALAGWQQREGLAQTGFLDRDQIFRLAAQAARRAAELEDEERQRQAELERRDRAYWRDTGAGQDEAGLRAYLERYPQGIFAGVARERLAEIDARRRAEALARDRAAWQEAQSFDTIEAYRAYLAAFPRGENAARAEARLLELERPDPIPEPDPRPDDGREAERALNLPRLTRVLVEQRLAFMGYDPGGIDGNFDRDTRRAIRRFQSDYGLPETGYLDEAALGMLLPGGLLRLLD